MRNLFKARNAATVSPTCCFAAFLDLDPISPSVSLVTLLYVVVAVFPSQDLCFCSCVYFGLRGHYTLMFQMRVLVQLML